MTVTPCLQHTGVIQLIHIISKRSEENAILHLTYIIVTDPLFTENLPQSVISLQFLIICEPIPFHISILSSQYSTFRQED